jgi:CheY-like chemotaxis protein/HPt (histidine-containing phosphotransfer) domain-containing protein
LGLTISSTLVKMMSGRMWVESAEGAGSTFHFTASFETAALPAATSRELPSAAVTASLATAATLPTAVAAAAAPIRRVNVLVAEDNLVNQRVALGLLTRRGHTVTVANNGREALVALERDSFDLVLMDVQMPEMGGLEATAAIRQRERATGAHMRIVAMTAHVMTGDREMCVAAGMDGYLSKPIDPKLLFAAVEQGATGMVVPEPARPAAAVDYDDLLERLGGDVELVVDVTRLFLEFCPSSVSAIKAAIDNRDARGIATSAHALKGAAANLSAHALCDAAQTLERLGEESRLEPAEAAWRRLSVEAAAVMDTLRHFEGVHQEVA